MHYMPTETQLWHGMTNFSFIRFPSFFLLKWKLLSKSQRTEMHLNKENKYIWFIRNIMQVSLINPK